MLIGHLTRDPELRITPKGTAICQFGLAINRDYKAEDGSKREEVTFVDVEAWGKQAETLTKYVTKGRPLYVEGRLKLDSWDDKTTGQKRSKMKVVVESFQFLGGRDDAKSGSESSEGAREQSTPPSSPPPRPQTAQQQGNIDEDVPF